MQKIPWNYFATGMLCLLFLMPAASSAGQQGAGAWNEIGAAVGQVQSGLADARGKGRLSFDLQKQLLKKAGDCISAMAELEQKTDFSKSGAKEDAKALFIKNGGVLRELLSLNRSKIAALEETKLEHAQDPSALFASAEWQEPQALVLLSGYWLSWNNYYAALVYAADDGKRHELLEEALTGFGSTLLDVREEPVMLRSLFGRALCLKEMGRYDKALQDLNSVTAKAGRENSLYAQAAYEKALISYLTGKDEKALGQLKELEADPAAIRVLKDAPKRLASKIALATLEKSTAQQAGSPAGNDRDTLKELKRLAETNEAQAGALYQFVAGHAAQLKDAPDAELGSMGSLAIADWHFNRKEYDAALARYRRLYALPDQSLQTYRSDVCFRLAYCLCNRSEWQEALGCLETLFEKYPRSSASGQAACLYYLAAATAYRQNSSASAYSRYIRAAQSYLKNCPDPKDKSEAHYQVGSYYQNKKMEKEALAEFALVGSDNPHYGQSRRAAIAAGVEEIESLHRQGAGQTDGAKKLYQKTLSQLQECRKVLSGKGGAAEGKELEAQLIILQARLAACGPDEAAKTALDLLAGFETRFSQSKQSAQLVYGAKVLRVESLLRLGMLKEADGEMAALLKEGGRGQDAWTFLNQAALALTLRSSQRGMRLLSMDHAPSRKRVIPIAVNKKDTHCSSG